jgi:hypothetical protein
VFDGWNFFSCTASKLSLWMHQVPTYTELPPMTTFHNFPQSIQQNSILPSISLTTQYPWSSCALFQLSTTPWRRIGEWRYGFTNFLTSALDGGEWSASLPGRFTPRERTPGTHRIGGWVGPRVVLDAVVKRKIPSRRRESNPRTPIVHSVRQRYTDWAITALPGAISPLPNTSSWRGT